MTTVTLELLPTQADQTHLIRNLYQFYAYETSDWELEDVDADGCFYIHEEYLARYWQEPDWSAQLVMVEGCIAGFVLIERSEVPGIDALELADLFILKKYRRQGIGRAVALHALSDTRHPWLVRFHQQDDVAQAFWQSVVEELPRPSREIELPDDPTLVNFLVTSALH